MAKRAATTELNQENWYKEDEPEEPGIFQKASSEVLETRVIKTAKRRVKMSDSSSDSKSSPFSSFAGFGSASTTSNTKSPFSFLSQQNKSKVSDDGNKNGTKEENSISSLTKEGPPQFKSFTNSMPGVNQQKDVTNFTSSLAQKNSASTEMTFKPSENIFKMTQPENEKDKKSKSLELLKDLNLSCSSWISEHLEKNPYCILTPIFKDYEKHLAQLGLDDYSANNKDVEIVLEKTSSSNNTIKENTKSLSPSKEESTGTDSLEKEKEKEKQVEKTKGIEFKFENVQPNPSFTFQFGTGGSTTFGATNTSFSLNKIAAKPVTAENECKNDEESEEPPKNDFVPVIEEDSIFDMKCKVFVKKEGNFVPRGVGTLFLKPVKDSTKTQLIVRAHTNLGNILLNTLLVPGMPIQKTGKNNAMVVCVPTPEAQPPPVPVLIRVKTSEECDNLIKKLEECRGS